jgi:hypothetical protein
MPEILTTIAIIGIMAAIAIATFTDIGSGTTSILAEQTTSQLNAATRGFSQTRWSIPTPGDDSSTDDEFKVLRSLQWIPPGRGGRESFTQYWNPTASSNVNDYRIRWNGVSFTLIPKGTTGSGLRIAENGMDQSSDPYSFPNNYKPEGQR